jgi:flagellar hook-associated protein 3 FlgL
MSAIGPAGTSDYATMNSLINESSLVRQKLDRLTNQASTGLVGDTYAGLGAGASVSLALRPQMANLQTWQNNVDAATGRMGVAQSALSQIQSVAANFYAQVNNLSGANASEVDTIAASARDALSQVADLLDTQDGGVYVFAGQDTASPPVPGPDRILTSGFYTQINTAVSNLGVAGPAATAAATLAVASSNSSGTSPFSAYLSQPVAVLQPQAPTVQVGPNQSAKIGLLASTNSVATSAGSSTTGSYVRDVMRALATIGSLSSTGVNTNGFQALVQDTRTSLSGAIGAMATDVGVLGNTQSSLASTKTQLADTATVLAGQVSSAEDVDMAKTLSQLALLQTQMQASYQLIANMSSLSLAKFLPIG